MATPTTYERITQINSGTALTRTRTGDVIELDNGTSGSAQIQLSNAIGGQVVDFGVAYITSSNLVAGTIHVFPFNSTLAATPSFVSIQIMCTSANLTVITGNVIYDVLNTSGFQVALSGMPSDNSHKLVWTAYY